MHAKELDEIDHFLKNLKRRFLLMKSISSIAFSLAILFAGLSFFPVVNGFMKDYDASSAFYLFLAVVLLLSSVRIIKNFFLLRNEIAVIKSLKGYFLPELTDEFISAIEFKKRFSEDIPVSKELMAAHINNVKEKLSLISSLPIPYVSPEARSYLTAGALFFIFMVALYAFSRDSRDLYQSIFRQEILQDKTILSSVDIRYIFPAYTGRTPREFKNTDGNISAIKGSVAELSFLLNERTDSAELILGSGSQIPLTKEGGRFNGVLNIERDDTYTIELKRGRKRIRDQFIRTIKVLEDSIPAVDALVEGYSERIAPGDVVQFTYHASDDFGIEGITLNCEGTSGKIIKHVIKKETALVSKEISGEYLWDTSPLNFKRDEVVDCYVSVFDNDTISGPKEGRSSIFHFKIGATSSQEILLEEIKALFEKSVIALALVLEDNRKKSKFIAGLINVVSELKAKSSEIIKNISKASGKLSEYLIRTDSDISSILNEISACVKDNNKKEKVPGTVTEKFEKLVLDLYALLKFGKYGLFLNSAEDILAYQQHLLEEFKLGNEDTLYKKIETLERSIGEMFKNLAPSRDFTDEFINPDALKEMGSFSLFDKLQRIKSLLKEGKIEEAKKLFEEFMSEYNEMIARMKEFINSTTLAEFGEFLKQLDALQKNLKDLLLREVKIKSDIKNITEGARGGDLKEWIRKELEKVVRLKKYAEVIEKETEQFNIQASKEAKRRIELIHSYLENAGFYDALKETKSSLYNFESLRFHPQLNNHSKLLNEINSAISLNREIKNDIEDLLNRLQISHDDSSRQKLQELSQEQERIEKRTRELSKELDRSQSQSKVLKTPIPEMLSGAADFMKGAKKRLKDLDAEGGLKNVEDSLDQLSKIDDLIENMKSGKKMPLFLPFFASGEGSYGDLTGRVELPGEDETAYQKEIKEELLKAISGRLPDTLVEENKKYLKELLR